MNYNLKKLNKNNQLAEIEQIFATRDNWAIEHLLKNFVEKYKLDEDVIRMVFAATPKCWWNYIVKSQKLSEEFMREFRNEIDMKCAGTQQIMSEEFLNEMKDKVSFSTVARYHSLSEKFIERYSNDLNWKYISSQQIFSEQFMEKYWEKINWNEYFYFTVKINELSEEFIFKHIDDIFANTSVRNKFFWQRTKELSPWLNKEFKKRYNNDYC